MTIRARLAVAGTVLLVGAATAACGGSGAPTDADKDRFCDAANSLMSGLVAQDSTTPDLPSDEDMAQAVRDWGERMAEVGTPDDIPDDARTGFETVVDQAGQVDASDFSLDSLEELEQGGADASAEVRQQAAAFEDYLTTTCGNPLDDIEMPQLEAPDTTG
jgi:hypothetical protein